MQNAMAMGGGMGGVSPEENLLKKILMQGGGRDKKEEIDQEAGKTSYKRLCLGHKKITIYTPDNLIIS